MVPSTGMCPVIVKAWKKKCFQIFEWKCDGRLVTMGIGQTSHHVQSLQVRASSYNSNKSTN
jgi:hypothetical protein